MVTPLAEIVSQLAEKLLASGKTVAFAESCTGGRAMAMLATYPGISASLHGGVVAYANEVKHDLLGVSNDTLSRVGAVSREVALEMARGVRKRLAVDWAVSITGIAGPGGGTTLKPVGLVFFGVCGPWIEEADEQRFSGDRPKIQQSAAEHALTLLARRLGS